MERPEFPGKRRLARRSQALVAALFAAVGVAMAFPAAAAGSRLLATGGVTQLEGAAGGGLAAGFGNRAELSDARQEFSLGRTVPGESLRVDVVGAKLRLAGDAVYDQDRWLPQLAVGLQFKHNRDFDLVPAALGARRSTDVDFADVFVAYFPAKRFSIVAAWARLGNIANRPSQAGPCLSVQASF